MHQILRMERIRAGNDIEKRHLSAAIFLQQLPHLLAHLGFLLSQIGALSRIGVVVIEIQIGVIQTAEEGVVLVSDPSVVLVHGGDELASAFGFTVHGRDQALALNPSGRFHAQHLKDGGGRGPGLK